MGSAYPGVRARDVGPTSLYRYKAADGMELDGVLTLPPGPARKGLPVIVMPHGGPIGARDNVGFDWWAQAFASRGYAVFQPNYRGSSGHGLAFERAGYKEWGRKMLSDMADGLHALAADGTIDPKRACIVGGSYGGYAAMAGVTVQQGLYRCAVSLAGVSDLSEMIRWERENWGVLNASMRYERTALGIGEADAPKLEDISPVRLAAKADAPLLLIHGTDDTVVAIDQSRRMASALKAAGKPFDYLELKGDDHWLSRGETRSAMLKAAMAFVEKQNPAN
jgi:dipeptidyl aminopeptidase/acylaminoacyl peptidase